MSGKRRRFSGELKAKVALEAFRGERTGEERFYGVGDEVMASSRLRLCGRRRPPHEWSE